MVIQTRIAPAALVALLAISAQVLPLIECVPALLLVLTLCFPLVLPRHRPLAVPTNCMAVTIASTLQLLTELERELRALVALFELS